MVGGYCRDVCAKILVTSANIYVLLFVASCYYRDV